MVALRFENFEEFARSLIAGRESRAMRTLCCVLAIVALPLFGCKVAPSASLQPSLTFTSRERTPPVCDEVLMGNRCTDRCLIAS